MKARIRLCPLCGTPGEVVARREDEPTVIVECPECWHEWEAAGAESAFAAFRSQLRIDRDYRYVIPTGGMR